MSDFNGTSIILSFQRYDKISLYGAIALVNAFSYCLHIMSEFYAN